METSGSNATGPIAGSHPDRRADAPTNEAGAQYHLHLAAGQIPTTILMPGDPGRVERIAATWDEGEELAFHREYRSARGRFGGVDIGAISSGVGAPSLEIAAQEFATIGGETIIRVGTTGALQPEMELGDLIVPFAAVRRDGTSERYLPLEYPAYADPEVTYALIEACQRLGYRWHLGLVCSVSSFYLGQERPVHGGFWQSAADGLIADLRRAGVTNLEMECSALFVLSRLLGMRSGSVLGVVANRATNAFGDNGAEERTIRVANEAVVILAEWARLKAAAGTKLFYPSLLRGSR